MLIEQEEIMRWFIKMLFLLSCVGFNEQSQGCFRTKVVFFSLGEFLSFNQFLLNCGKIFSKLNLRLF